jgi:hypothetical protein
MKKQKLNINGVLVSVKDNDYISLTDIARHRDADTPAFIVRNWLKNQNTLMFLETWETVHNENFDIEASRSFRLANGSGGFSPTPRKYIEQTKAISLRSSAGRYGGTFAHSEVALHFCFWFDATFQVYLMKEFQRLKKEEFERKQISQEWHISKITDYVDNARILLDSIPGQLPENVRMKLGEEE